MLVPRMSRKPHMHVNALEMRRTGSSKLLESTCMLRVTLFAHRRHLDRSLCCFSIAEARLSWVSSVCNFPSNLPGRTLRIHRFGFVSRISLSFPSSYQYPPLPGAIFSHSRTHCSRQLLASAFPERALHHPPRTTAPARFLRLHRVSLSLLLLHLSISSAVGFFVCGRFGRRIALVMVK